MSRPEAALATFIVGKATESFKHFGTVSPYFCGWVPQGLSYSRAGFLDVLYQGHDLKDLVLEAQGRAAAVLRDARWCALVDRSDGTAPLLVLVQDRMRSTSTRLVQEFTKTPKGWRPAAPWRVEGVGPPICLVPWEPPA